MGSQFENPYLIKGPAQIAFSGGRSSAYMLYHILDAHEGRLPNSVVISFQNTGREMPETLDFIEACSKAWNLEIHWVEYAPEFPDKWKYVDYESAARNGEPFAALVKHKQYLPNPCARFCTAELKVRTAKRFMLAQGFEHWESILGLRADEPKRVMRSCGPTRERWINLCPLATAGVSKQQVAAFWAEQPFDLALPNANGRTPLGNCDLCFMKSERTLAGIMRDYPERAAWWIDLEETISTTKGKLARFNVNYTYRELANIVADQGDWLFDEGTDFFCDASHGGCTD